MPLVRVKLDDGAEANVGESFAESHNLTVLDKPTHRRGRPVPTKYPVSLKGAALTAALATAGLSTSGTADEKRQRLDAHQASGATDAGETTPGGESATSEEDS